MLKFENSQTWTKLNPWKHKYSTDINHSPINSGITIIFLIMSRLCDILNTNLSFNLCGLSLFFRRVILCGMTSCLSIGQLPPSISTCPVIILVVPDKRTSAYFEPGFWSHTAQKVSWACDVGNWVMWGCFFFFFFLNKYLELNNHSSQSMPNCQWVTQCMKDMTGWEFLGSSRG